ncbi:P-type conjugative transfer protein TrbJ [Maritalea sp.]|uniref:P-type conjugative transfer protein TrbJ n=1 Tax=Maritalea sp. TaxID=2003361 RepID=UPI003EF676D7
MKSLITLFTLSLIAPVAFAGDIATERTQAATGVIVAKIQQISDTISTAEAAIQDYEKLANNKIGELLGNNFNLIPGVGDVFTILRNIEDVVREGEALAHTYADLDTFMRDRFGGFDKYYDLVTAAGGIDRGDMNQRFEDWSTSHLDTIKNTLKAHGLHTADVATSEARLSTLQNLSRSASGRMQALQIGQEIAVEEIKQIHSLKEIIMEQSNLNASYFAMKQSMKAEKEAFDSWINRDLGLPTILDNDAALPRP